MLAAYRVADSIAPCPPPFILTPSLRLITTLVPSTQQVLQQIQIQLVRSRKDLSLVTAQIQAKEKERRILQLTSRELGSVPEREEKGDEVKMYKGVGKM